MVHLEAYMDIEIDIIEAYIDTSLVENGKKILKRLSFLIDRKIENIDIPTYLESIEDIEGDVERITNDIDEYIDEGESFEEVLSTALSDLMDEQSVALSNQLLEEDGTPTGENTLDPDDYIDPINEANAMKERLKEVKNTHSLINSDLITGIKLLNNHIGGLNPRLIKSFDSEPAIMLMAKKEEINVSKIVSDSIDKDISLKVHVHAFSADNFSTFIEKSFSYNKKHYKGWPYRTGFFLHKDTTTLLLFYSSDNDQRIVASMIIDAFVLEEEFNKLSGFIQAYINNERKDSEYSKVFLAKPENVFRHDLDVQDFSSMLNTKFKQAGEKDINKVLFSMSLENTYNNDDVWKYAEDILFPYYCNQKDFPFYYISQSGMHFNRPKNLYNNSQKRPDYIINSEMALPIYIDVKCRSQNKGFYTINKNEIEALRSIEPFIFFAVFDKADVIEYIQLNTSRNEFPEPKFISLSQLEKLIDNKNNIKNESLQVPDKSLQVFETVLDMTILKWFKDGRTAKK